MRPKPAFSLTYAHDVTQPNRRRHVPGDTRRADRGGTVRTLLDRLMAIKALMDLEATAASLQPESNVGF